LHGFGDEWSSGRVGQSTGRFAGQVDAGGLAESESSGPEVQAVVSGGSGSSQSPRGVEEEHIAAAAECIAESDSAVADSELTKHVAAVSSWLVEESLARDAVIGWQQAAFE
jgi:hypothetical protein